jgi:serine/threonine protein kinase
MSAATDAIISGSHAISISTLDFISDDIVPDDSLGRDETFESDVEPNAFTVAEKYNILPSSGMILFPEDIEADDYLHDPTIDLKTRQPIMTSERKNPWSLNLFSLFNDKTSLADTDSLRTFWTASSSIFAGSMLSISTYFTATSGTSRTELLPESSFEKRILEEGLKPTPMEELDWSGRGEFIEFKSNEEVPLTVVRELASTSTAIVEEVQCRRIRLARKSMFARPEARLSAALDEIRHLKKLKHAHIVRIVGAYVLEREISILTYPVADYDLESFLKEFMYLEQTRENLSEIAVFLQKAPSCLSHGLAFVHENLIRHLDIKPKNVLVRRKMVSHERKPAAVDDLSAYKVYLCDFGISTSFSSELDTKTDRPTARTWTYCAPEVIEGDSYGRAADVFSLGCIFAEIATCLAGKSLKTFSCFRSGSIGRDGRLAEDSSFHANIPLVREWLRCLDIVSSTPGRTGQIWDPRCLDEIFWTTIKSTDIGGNYCSIFLEATDRMLSADPFCRPTLAQLLATMRNFACCYEDVESFTQPNEPTPLQELVPQIQKPPPAALRG